MSFHKGSSALGAAWHGGHLLDQRHSTYPAQAHGVWREVLARNAALIEKHGQWMNPAYMQGMQELELPTRVPQIEELNRRLAPTGWHTVCVDGYIPSDVYAALISQCIFPISRRVRRAEHIDYSPEPDLAHDVLGHLPMLFSPEYRRYLQRFGELMAQASDNPLDRLHFATVRRLAAIKSDPESSPAETAEAESQIRQVSESSAAGASELTELRRMYVWSVEFGLLGSGDDFLIHGAALLSAPAEFRNLCFRGAACLSSFGIHVVEHENAFSDLLSQYFLARDFAHLEDVLSEYELRMARRAGLPRTSERHGCVERRSPALARAQ